MFILLYDDVCMCNIHLEKNIIYKKKKQVDFTLHNYTWDVEGVEIITSDFYTEQ